MSVFQNRLESYRAIQTELGRRQREVYMRLREAPSVGMDMSNREIALSLHWPVNCVTGRVKELRDDGLVVESCVRWDCVTRRNVTAWKAKL